jgi:hypothetical protein
VGSETVLAPAPWLDIDASALEHAATLVLKQPYHPQEALHLAELINAGLYDQAEAQAREFIATYTDFAQRWTSNTAVESYLRDCGFNRGPRGAARILQRALHVRDDGVVGG